MNRTSTVQLYRQLLGSSDDRQQSLWRHESTSSTNELAPFPVHNYLPVIEGALGALLTLGCRPHQGSGRATTSSPSMGTDVALVVSFFKALCLPEAQWENVYGVRLEEEEMKVELVLCRGMRNLDWSEALRYRLSGKDQLQPDTLHMLAAAHVVPLHWRAIPLFDRLSYFTYLCEENSLDILSALLEFHELERMFAGLNYDDGTSELLMSAAEYLSDANVFESLLNQTLWGDTVKLPTSSASSSGIGGQDDENDDGTYVDLDERDLNACVLAALSNRNVNGAGAKIAQVLFQSKKLGHRIQIAEPGSVAARRWVEKAFHSGQASTVDFVLDDLILWGGLDAPSTTKEGALTTLKMSEGNQISSEASATVHQRQRLLAKQVLDSIPSLASVVRWGTVQLLGSVLERACNVYARFRVQGPSPSELNRVGSDSSVDSEPNDKEQKKTNCWSDWMTEKLSISHIALFRSDDGEMVRYLASIGLLQPQRITSAWWDALIGECILGTVLKAGAVRAFAAMQGLMRPTVDMVAPLVLSCIVPHQVPAVVRNLQVLEEVLGLDLDGELSDISRLARPTVTYFAGMTLLDVLLAAPLYAFLDLFIFLNSRSKISIHQQRANGQSRFQVARWRGHEDIVAYCEKL
jgi:hypothetical protein